MSGSCSISRGVPTARQLHTTKLRCAEQAAGDRTGQSPRTGGSIWPWHVGGRDRITLCALGHTTGTDVALRSHQPRGSVVRAEWRAGEQSSRVNGRKEGRDVSSKPCNGRGRALREPRGRTHVSAACSGEGEKPEAERPEGGQPAGGHQVHP